MAYNNRLTHIIGGNTAGVTARIVSGTYQLAGGSNISLSQNGNTVSIIGLSALNANPALSGSNGSFTFQTATFGNLNGMSFYTSNGSLVGSYTVPSTAGLISAINLSAGSTSNNLTAVTFSNLNGVSFGLNGSVITGSHNGLTSQSNQAISAGNGSFAFQTVSFSNANGISFSTNAGSAIIASHNGLTTARASNDGVGLNTAQTNVTWTVNSSGISLNASGYAGIGTSATNASITLNSNGLAISVATALTSQSNQAASASNGSFTFQTIGFSNANNVTFGTSAGSIVTASVLAQTNQTIGGYAAGNTTGQSSSSTFDARTVSFNGAGNVSVGYSGGSIVISGGTAAPSPVNFSAGTTSNNLGVVVFSNSNGVSFGLNGSTITASAAGGGVAIAASNTTFTSGTIVMSNNGGALTISSGAQSILFSVPQTSSLSGTGIISISTNGSTISIGVPAPAASASNGSFSFNTLAFSNANNVTFGTSAGSIITASIVPDVIYAGGYELFNYPIFNNNVILMGSILVAPFKAPNFKFDRIDQLVRYTIATNSTGSHTLSYWLGIYTRTSQTLSLLSSISTAYSTVGSGTANSTGFANLRYITIGSTGTVTAGDYWFAHVGSTSSAGANASYQIVIGGLQPTGFAYNGILGASSNNTNQPLLGYGTYSSTAYTMPNSMAFTNIFGTNQNGSAMPKVIFNSLMP